MVWTFGWVVARWRLNWGSRFGLLRMQHWLMQRREAGPQASAGQNGNEGRRESVAVCGAAEKEQKSAQLPGFDDLVFWCKLRKIITIMIILIILM